MGYEMETVNLALGRWVKLQKDFFDIRTQKFDLSKAGVVFGLVNCRSRRCMIASSLIASTTQDSR